MFSIRLMMKLNASSLNDAFSVIRGIFTSIKYHDESATFSEVRKMEGEGLGQEFTVTKASDPDHSYIIQMESLSKDSFGYILLEIFFTKEPCPLEKENIQSKADLLFRYLQEFLQQRDVVLASIHTSLEPLCFSDLDGRGFPPRIGWATYFGKELCALIGKDLLLGAREHIFTAYEEKMQRGVLWKMTGSIHNRPGILGNINLLRRYMGQHLFRLTQLVEESCFSLHYGITGKANVFAPTDDIVSTFENFFQCSLEQYKDLWDTLEGSIFGSKVGLGFEEKENGYDCTLDLMNHHFYGNDVIEIDISDYLYTLARLHSMTPDPQPQRIDCRKAKNVNYTLQAEVEFKHKSPMEDLSEKIIDIFDCIHFAHQENTLIMSLLGLNLILTQTQQYEGQNYYRISIEQKHRIDEDWRSIDLNEFIISLLKNGGIIGGKGIVYPSWPT